MLLRMGADHNPIADNTRGTVIGVDDIGTLHCSFDNGRSLGIVPSEDSFRKLTDTELAEEQAKTESEPLWERLLTEAANRRTPIEEIVVQAIQKYMEGEKDIAN